MKFETTAQFQDYAESVTHSRFKYLGEGDWIYLHAQVEDDNMTVTQAINRANMWNQDMRREEEADSQAARRFEADH